MSKSVGMAVRLTRENAEHVAFFNNGVVLAPEDDTPTVFFFPYDCDGVCSFIPEDEFLQRYRGDVSLREDYFIDVYEATQIPENPVPYHFRYLVHS